MSVRIPLFTSHAGITHTLVYDPDGTIREEATADSQDILDRNVSLANHNDGYSPSREMRRVASIPFALRNKWLAEEGWDAFDPEYSDRLNRVLNDSNWSKLRTAPGRV